MGLTIAGRQIDNALEIWQSYANRHQTLHDYDLAGAGEPTMLTETEVVLLLRRAADAPLRCLSADADLADADPIQRGGVFDKAASLYWHFTTPHEPGFGAAKLHKVLHIKRPLIYPLLDRLVRRLYRTQARAWVEQLPNTRRGDSVTFWAAIRADLIDSDNLAELAPYRKTLRRMPQTQAMASLPALRLLSSPLAWCTGS